jgi:hypothetical protein
MPYTPSRKRKKTPKRVLALPDLEHAKSAVVSSLTSRSGQRTYDHAIREFVAWYCSEPRLAFQPHCGPPLSDSPRAAAVRAGNHQSAAGSRSSCCIRGGGCGVPEPRIGSGHPSRKGVRRLGVRLGNWLTPEQGRRLLEHARPVTLRAARDHAMLAMLIGCG